MVAGCIHCSKASICLPAQLQHHLSTFSSFFEFKTRRLKRHEYLSRQGDLSNQLYILQTGTLKGYVTKKNTEQCVMGFYFPPDLFGWEGLDPEFRATSIVALEDSVICQIPTEKLLLLTQKIPVMGMQLLKMVSRRIHQDNIALMHASAPQRAATFLLQLSQRFSEIQLSATQWQFKMTQQDIANYLRMTASTLSRILNDFEKRKIIVMRKHTIQLMNMNALQLIAESDSSY